MSKRLLFLRAIAVCLQVVLTASYAFAVSEQEAAARNFLKFLQSDKGIQSVQILEGSSLDPAASPIPIAHRFQLTGGGYIIVAPTKDLTPIKAYSLKNDFDALPPAYRKALLDELEAHVRELQPGPARAVQSNGVSETHQRWDFLLNFDAGRFPLAYTPDTFLLSTTWDQGDPYNKFLPDVSGARTLTGCVNTAIGQIMKYHGHPAQGRGVVSYSWSGQSLEAILYRPYNWANMPAKLETDTPEYQTDEVARFMRDIGIANYTNYGVDNSAAGLNTGALIENFGYSTSIRDMDNTDVNAFFAALKSEIDAGRPVYLAFPGHATVADGYAADGTGRKIHVNMGWQGSYDNYYYLDQPVVAGGHTYPTTPGRLRIHFNIKPCSGADCSWNIETGDGISNRVISGKFDFEDDSDRYETYLKGNTTVMATRGYGNIAFYVDFYKLSDGTHIYSISGDQSSAQTQTFTAPAGKYQVDVSYCGSLGCYSLSNESYTVTLTTETLTPQEIAAADAAVESAPVIFNDFSYILINSNNTGPYRILVDARDENGDVVTLQVENTNTQAVTAAFNSTVLEITPVAGATNTAATVRVRATAGSDIAEKSFVILVSNEDVGSGKSFKIAGSFENQSDYNRHKVILDGACSISGFNGYSSQAFYTSVLNANGTTLIAAGNETISGTFPRGIYLVGASLEQNPGGNGYYYRYEAGKNDSYSLTVNCSSADDTVATVAGLLGIDLTGAQFPYGDVNGDGSVTIADGIEALQITSGMSITGQTVNTGADVNGDSKIGLEETLYILQKGAGGR